MNFEEQIMSEDRNLCIFLKSNGGFCVYQPSNIFSKGRINSVGAQNIVSLFKLRCSFHFNNLFGMNTKRANVMGWYRSRSYSFLFNSS